MINVSLKNSIMKKCPAPGRRRVLIAFLIIVLLPISLPLHTSARENVGNIWYFGDEAGLDFNTGITPTALTDSVSLSSGGSAVISDQEGNLLFYTDGTQVWNTHHETMPNGQGLMGSSLADQPAIIVPNPGNPNLYYIFTVSARLGLYYSKVNLALDEGLGEVTEKNIRLWPAAAGKITAVKHKNATDIWVIVPSAKDNTFHTYLVTASGVNHTPVVSQSGIGHSKCEFDFSGYLKASPGGSKLALSVFDPGFFELFDFDTATGTVSNPLFLGEYEAASGIEFSPDSSKLYATVVNWVRKKIYQFDLESTDIPHSVQVIGENSEESRFRALQVGPDGRVYVARENTLYVGVINYPNRLGLASDYVDNGAYLEGRFCRNDLPNFVQSFFKPPVITLTIHDTVANEAEKTATFTVSLSEVSRSAILVDYITHEGTATAESDYITTSGTVTIPKGAIEGSFTIPIIDDDLFDEGPETFSIELSNPVRAVLADYQGIGIIQENDLVEMTIEDTAAEEGDGFLEFTVSLSQASRLDVSGDYSTNDGTATADSEYTATSGTLTIPAGDLSATIVVDIIDDKLDEQDKTFTVHLSNPVNAAITDNQAVGTIIDNDAPPTISIHDVIMDEKADTMTFTVTLSAVSMLDVMVDYTTRDDTATAHNDYTATSGTVFIPAGAPFGAIMVDVTDDVLDEQHETFTLALSNPVHATLADDDGVGTITDNDPPPALSIDDVTVDEDIGIMLFTISLSAVSEQDVLVNYATQDDTALAGRDYAMVSGAVIVPPGRVSVTIPVTIIDDSHDGYDETLTVQLSKPVNATLGDNHGTGTITDNERL